MRTTVLFRVTLLVELLFCVFVNVATAGTVAVRLVRAIDTSTLTPPMTDPTGVIYLRESNTLFVVDSEVDETPLYQGVNGSRFSLSGDLLEAAWNFFTFWGPGNSILSIEPSGLTAGPVPGHVLYCDDDALKVVEVDLATGAEVRSFSTRNFGATDPEGVAIDPSNGHLFVLDGNLGSLRVYELSPGANGVFDGIGPSTDDALVNEFDVVPLGMSDPEGLEFVPHRGTLLISGEGPQPVIEVSKTGALLNVIDVGFLNLILPSSLAYGPSSFSPSVPALYITDRGIDNDVDPSENDGKIYEIVAGAEPSFRASHDGRVDKNSPNTRYGSTADLRVRGPKDATGTNEKRSFLKFDVGGITGTIVSAKLRLFVLDTSVAPVSIFAASNQSGSSSQPWSEAALTWNNQPVLLGASLNAFAATTVNRYVEVDVTSAITGPGTYSFGLLSSSNDESRFSSDEAQANRRPQLLITTAAAP